MSKFICAICGKEVNGFGNNPQGALNEDGTLAEFKDTDRCCDDCNNTYVLSGRIKAMGISKEFIPVPKNKI